METEEILTSTTWKYTATTVHTITERGLCLGNEKYSSILNLKILDNYLLLMEKITDHVLRKEGVLFSFSVRQIMTIEEFKRVMTKLYSETDDTKAIEAKFKKYCEEMSLLPIPGEIITDDYQSVAPVTKNIHKFNEHVYFLMNYLRKHCEDDDERISLLNIVSDKLGI